MAQKQKVTSDIFGQNDFLIPLDSSRRGAFTGINVTSVAVTCKMLYVKNSSVLKGDTNFENEQRVLY